MRGLRRWLWPFTIGALLALLIIFPMATARPADAAPTDGSSQIAASGAGSYRGVSLFYLDGVAQDLPWILANQNDPTVNAKLISLFDAYQAAHVNWIRLLVAYNHFGTATDPIWITRVNALMALASTRGAFTFEVMLITQRDANDYYLSTLSNNYASDQQWLSMWTQGLNYSHLGLIMIGGDLFPCAWTGLGGTWHVGCQGDGSAIEPRSENHGRWIKAMWPWYKATYPGVNTAFEVFGDDSSPNLQWTLLKRVAQWVNGLSPSVPVVATPLYFTLPPGSTWQAYANKTMTALNAYNAAGVPKTLWIDEYGMSIGLQPNGWTYTAADQEAYYSGFLAATTCWTTTQYPKFAWVTGRDYPGDGNRSFGLVGSFSGNAPNWYPAWSDIGLYYNPSTCP